MRLNHKLAIVTGGARGIGLACVKRFRQEGAHVIIADVLADEAEKAAAETGAQFIPCDVSSSDNVSTLIDQIAATGKTIDILLNNAAIIGAGDFLSLAEADFDKVISINLKGAFLMSQAVARHMVVQCEQGKPAGTIINMSSVNDTLAIPSIVSYCVAKGGISQLTRACALALAPYGIRVNAIGPGSIMTEMLQSLLTDKQAHDRILSRTPLGRLGQPEEIANIAVFLASSEASYITGQTIYADGGRLPLNYTVPVPI